LFFPPKSDELAISNAGPNRYERQSLQGDQSMTKVTRKTRRLLLGTTAALVWAGVGATFTQTLTLAAKAPLTIQLTTEPKAVKIRAGRQQLFDGRYHQPPVKISLPPGRHNLTISREGFVTHAIAVFGRAGEKITVDHMLEPSRNF